MTGDEAAFAELIRTAAADTVRRVERKLRSAPVLRSTLTADDILQEATLAAIRGFPTFQIAQGLSPGESFKRWFTTIVDHRFRDAIDVARAAKRGGGRTRTLDGPSDSFHQIAVAIAKTWCAPSRRAQRDELVAAIRHAVPLLPAHCREVIELQLVYGLSHREIAGHLGKSEVAVRKIASRAIGALREKIAGQQRAAGLS